MFETLESPQYRPMVKAAVPYGVGDSYKGQRIIGTLPTLFTGAMEYRPGKTYQIDQGKIFDANKFQAVIGADVPRLTGLKLGDNFQATHGMPAPNVTPDIHEEQWQVVGVLKPTHTATDRVLFIPLTTFYCIFEHGEALQAHAAIRSGAAPGETKPWPKSAAPTGGGELLQSVEPATAPTSAPASAPSAEEEPKHYTVAPDGSITLTLPKEEWEVSAILVRSRSPFAAQSLMYQINNGQQALAVNPATEMRQFFNVFLEPSSQVLLLVSWLVTIVAAVGILVSIYNSVSARIREIAILRALGATRRRILTIICVEAGMIGLLGGILGVIAGHLLGAGGSVYTERLVGEGINWIRIAPAEWVYLLVVVLIAVLAGLVPAMKAYRVPVATNLVAG
jgi:putative ABC transport system permease protein